MSTFKSKATINRPVNEVYTFLADLRNHEQLMPDNVEDWKSTYDEASFSIKNMAKISLKVNNRVEDREIHIIPAEKPPFDLELKWSLLPNNAATDVLFVIDANLSMMMKMLASGPLQKLADHEIETVVSVFR